MKMQSILFPAMLFSLSLFADSLSGMKGTKSWNVGINAAPAQKNVVIDGKLNEWNLDGQIWTGDSRYKDQYSVKTAAMWDADFLYLSFQWKDPTPMHSIIDPDSKPDKGWVDDAIQLRLKAGDTCSWVTMWCFKKNTAALHIEYYKQEKGTKGRAVLLKTAPGKSRLGNSKAEMFYREDADGKGFVQEVKIPWTLIFKDNKKVTANEKIVMGFEYIWGNNAGDWPHTRTNDNFSQWDCQNSFFWVAEKSWGEIRFCDKPVKNTRTYKPDAESAYGCIPVRAKIPSGAEKFTIVMEDMNGKRIRTIVGGYPVKMAKVGSEKGYDIVEVLWDGLDDAMKPVQPGTFKLIGLTVGHVGAKYIMSFYNPGNPVWDTADGKGGWGADHSCPETAASAGENVVFGTKTPEGGYGTWAVGPDGKKVWSEKRASRQITANSKHVYSEGGFYYERNNLLFRLDSKTGKYDFFKKNGKNLPCPFPSKMIRGIGERTIKALAVSPDDKRLIAVLSDGSALMLHPNSLDVMKVLPISVKSFYPYGDRALNAGALGASWVAERVPVAFNGTHLYYFQEQGSVLVEFNVNDTSIRVISLEQPVEQPESMVLDANGNLLISDTGKDMQIKKFDINGKYLGAIGKKGGRTRMGKFEENGMLETSAIAVDQKGNVWAVEYTEYPRRISVWTPDGKFVRDYIGNAHYCGSGTFLHDNDPTRGYAGPVEIKLDLKKYTWRATAVLWNPDPKKPGLTFKINAGSHDNGNIFYSSASGKKREYYFKPSWQVPQAILLMNDNGQWRPVSAFFQVKAMNIGGLHRSIMAPVGELAGLDPNDGIFWNDDNADGYIQRRECTILPYKKFGPMPLVMGWGNNMDPETLSFCAMRGKDNAPWEKKNTDPIHEHWRMSPVGFKSNGAPIYKPEGMTNLGHQLMWEMPDIATVPGEDTIVKFNCVDKLCWFEGTDRKGKFKWRYPDFYHGVHGSHNSPDGNPWGRLFGPIKILGFASNCGDAKNVVMLRGNVANDFIFTTDGFYVDKMFKGVLEGLQFPATAEEARKMPYEDFVGGGEPFLGWFGRHSDGTIRMTNGMYALACHVAEVTGLDTIRYFKDGGTFIFTAAMAAKADEFNRELDQKKNKKAPAVQIVRVKGKPDLRKAKYIRITGAAKSEAKAALFMDDTNLYLHAEITNDETPWVNGGKDKNQMFKTGDCFDLQIGTNAANQQRIIFAKMQGRNIAVRMCPGAADAPDTENVTYASPVTSLLFKSVKIVDIPFTVRKSKTGWTLDATIPWNLIKVNPKDNLKGDLGFILSDGSGTKNAARIYYFNKRTGLISDLPNEARLAPGSWGELKK